MASVLVSLPFSDDENGTDRMEHMFIVGHGSVAALGRRQNVRPQNYPNEYETMCPCRICIFLIITVLIANSYISHYYTITLYYYDLL